MGKKEEIKYEEGSVLEKLNRTWEEQDRKARKEANRRFWKKVGIYGGVVLGSFGLFILLGRYGESHPFETGIGLGIFIGFLLTIMGISIYRAVKT